MVNITFCYIVPKKYVIRSKIRTKKKKMQTYNSVHTDKFFKNNEDTSELSHRIPTWWLYKHFICRYFKILLNIIY